MFKMKNFYITSMSDLFVTLSYPLTMNFGNKKSLTRGLFYLASTLVLETV